MKLMVAFLIGLIITHLTAPANAGVALNQLCQAAGYGPPGEFVRLAPAGCRLLGVKVLEVCLVGY